MKHALLALAFAGLALPGRAQAPNVGPWAVVNTTNVFSPPKFDVMSVQMVSPTVCWVLALDSLRGSLDGNRVLTSANAAGTEFNSFVINGSPGFSPTSVSAASSTLALCTQFGIGGEVLRTTNAGRTWQRITRPIDFAAPAGFPDWVHMFDANVAVAFGEPNPLPPAGTAGQFEIIRTANASAPVPTWTRVAALNIATMGNEYSQIGKDGYAALGNTLWATTVQSPGSPVTTSRVLRSIDQGLTWAGFATPLVEQITALAFKDQLNGLAFNHQLLPSGTTVVNLVRTADGGQTWAAVPLPAGADTLRGKFYSTNLTAIAGKGFVSVGKAEPGNPRRSNRGASFSPDGQRWYDLEKGGPAYSVATFNSCPGSPGARTFQGYLGGITDAAGAGGLYQIAPQTCARLPLATARHTANPLALTVTPNPSATGVFRVQLAATVVPGTQLTVFDNLGRVVLTHELLAPATGTTSFGLDLHRERSGLYILRVASNVGVATQKLLIE